MADARPVVPREMVTDMMRRASLPTWNFWAVIPSVLVMRPADPPLSYDVPSIWHATYSALLDRARCCWVTLSRWSVALGIDVMPSMPELVWYVPHPKALMMRMAVTAEFG